MIFKTGREICDECSSLNEPIMRDFSCIESSPDNLIVWYECGHVLIIKDGVVRQTFKY